MNPEPGRSGCQPSRQAAHRGRVLLLHPPYSDFTTPYHSLAYVAAPLLAAGFEVDVLDINILWFRNVFSTDSLRRWRSDLAAELDRFDRQPRMSLDDQQRVAQVVRGLALCSSLQPETAVRTFRSEDFYDAGRYIEARDQVRAFESLLDIVYVPLRFFDSFVVPPHKPNVAALVQESRASGRFVLDLARVLQAHLLASEYVFCGVTFPFSANLVPGMALLRAIRTVLPDLPLVCGGTAISDICKYRRSDEALAGFADICDYFYLGEAETAVVQAACFLAGETADRPAELIELRRPAPSEKLDYISLSGRESRRNFRPYDWKLQPPIYDWVQWDLYLSPVRHLLYAPSRGCFWNKCTFCDYGMNEDGPTAPSRTMDPEVVVDHLESLNRRLGISHFYLAADANSPAFLSRLADTLLARGTNIHWSCQLFLTPAFNDELLAQLQAAGLSVASFGLESGSSRVLELMGKGANRRERVLEPVLQAFRRSAISLQPLYFFGFPGETAAERQETVDLVNAYSDVFSPPARGGAFTLLANSSVARDPGRFGVANVRPNPCDDITWDLEFDLLDDTDALDPSTLALLNAQVPYCPAFERPWAGGIDVIHSQLYTERYGKGAFSQIALAWQTRQVPRAGLEVELSFDLSDVLGNAILSNSLAVGDDRVEGLLRREDAAHSVLDEILEEMHAGLDRLPQAGRYHFSVPFYDE